MVSQRQVFSGDKYLDSVLGMNDNFYFPFFFRQKFVAGIYLLLAFDTIIPANTESKSYPSVYVCVSLSSKTKKKKKE